MTTHFLRFERAPKAKERPRLSRNGKIYTPKATLEWERDLAEAWKSLGVEVIKGPVHLETMFGRDYVTIAVTELPESARSKLRGDIDNYQKIVLDALNGVAYADDRLVVMTSASKLY